MSTPRIRRVFDVFQIVGIPNHKQLSFESAHYGKGFHCYSDNYDYWTDIGPNQQHGDGKTKAQAANDWLEQNVEQLEQCA